MPDVVRISMSSADNREIRFTKKEYAKLVQIKIAGGEVFISIYHGAFRIHNISGRISAYGTLLGKPMKQSRKIIASRLGLTCYKAIN